LTTFTLHLFVFHLCRRSYTVCIVSHDQHQDVSWFWCSTFHADMRNWDA